MWHLPLLQVCTGVMMHGYGVVKKLCDELKEFMRKHNFSSIEDFRGYVVLDSSLLVIFYGCRKVLVSFIKKVPMPLNAILVPIITFLTLL